VAEPVTISSPVAYLKVPVNVPTFLTRGGSTRVSEASRSPWLMMEPTGFSCLITPPSCLIPSASSVMIIFIASASVNVSPFLTVAPSSTA